MALLNRFKRTRRDEKKPEKALQPTIKTEKKPKDKAQSEVKIKKELSEPAKPKKGGLRVIPRSLKSPHITEKATFLQEQDSYVFKVYSSTTKPEIKKSIEEIYGVNVLKVRIINVPRKKKRLGRTTGFQPGYKKAIITIKKGENIEVIPR